MTSLVKLRVQDLLFELDFYIMCFTRGRMIDVRPSFGTETPPHKVQAARAPASQQTVNTIPVICMYSTHEENEEVISAQSCVRCIVIHFVLVISATFN